MEDKVKTLLQGAGDRGTKVIHRGEEYLDPVAVADPNHENRVNFAQKYDIDSSKVFESGEQALDAGLDLDLVYIATPDKTHHKLAVHSLDKGYNTLIEKPMALTEEHCRDILQAQKRSGADLEVMYELRESNFYSRVKSFVDSQKFGPVVSIDAKEEVGSQHFANSYVRGNWRRQEDCFSSLLAKCSHDLDYITWLINSTPTKVNSTGGLDFFNENHAPEGAQKRCKSCLEECIFNAQDIYRGSHILNDEGEVKWPYNALSTNTDDEVRARLLDSTTYGQCVFRGDNDVLDNQTVDIEYENGAKAHFQMQALGEGNRFIKIYFAGGELIGDYNKNEITLREYTREHGKDKIEVITGPQLRGHGGGDEALIRNIAERIKSGEAASNSEEYIQSHLVAFAAERSRLTGTGVNLN